MKKLQLRIRSLLLIGAALVFAAGVLGTSVVRTTAQTNPKLKLTSQVTTGQLTPTPTVTPPAGGPTKVDYYLPYPGILPDHFLYPVKMIRDKVWLFFTRDPLKRAELLLLFADKRLGAGQALIEGGKAELGISTLTKGEKYLEQAVSQAEKAREKGKETRTLYEKLAKATLKHQEILVGVLSKVPDQAKEIIQRTMEYSRQGYETVTRLPGE